jgi:hypothetical protein
MKTIDTSWNELTVHPDYMASNIWNISDVSLAIESEIQNYLEEELEIDNIENERLELLSKEFVQLNKNKSFEIIL